MNSTIVKMKEEGEDRCKQINERIAIVEKKISVMDEKSENRNDKSSRAHDDQNQGKAVATGFHGGTFGAEVEQLLGVTITEIGMSVESARIECHAKPITHAFIYFKNDGERKEDKDDSVNGRRGKISSKKNAICQILYSHET